MVFGYLKSLAIFWLAIFLVFSNAKIDHLCVCACVSVCVLHTCRWWMDLNISRYILKNCLFKMFYSIILWPTYRHVHIIIRTITFYNNWNAYKESVINT